MLSCECTILIYTVTSQSKERFGIMEEFSLYVLDITMNSVRAGATDIRITLTEKDGMLTFSVTDNGCGMKAEQVKNLKDPFFTTRKTRAVGLGVPFLTMLAEQTGGGWISRHATRANIPKATAPPSQPPLAWTTSILSPWGTWSVR